MNAALRIETNRRPGKIKTAYCALIGCWLMPSSSAKVLSHISLKLAFGIHMTATILALAAIIPIHIAYINLYQVDLSLQEAFLSVSNEVVRDFSTAPTSTAFKSAVFLVAVEVTFVGAALLILPFAARHERACDSMRHALRRVWLHTCHITTIVLIVGLFGISLYLAQHQLQNSRWQQQMNKLFPYPMPLPKDADYAQRAAYIMATQEVAYQVVQYDATHPMPWYFRWADELIANSIFLAIIWFVWALYRGANGQRDTLTPSESPLCRQCGYNVTGISLDKLCPECGRSLLNTNTTSSAQFEDHPQHAYISCLRQIRDIWRTQPRIAAQRLRLTPRKSSHLRYLAVNLILCSILTMLGLTYVVHMAGPTVPSHWRFMMTIMLPSLSLLTAIILMCAVCIAALLPGMTWLIKDRRNVLPGTTQVACYCSGYFILWILANLVFIAAAMASEDITAALTEGWKVDVDVILGAVFTALNLVILVGYWIRVYNASAGVRYAFR